MLQSNRTPMISADEPFITMLFSDSIEYNVVLSPVTGSLFECCKSREVRKEQELYAD